MKYNKRNIIMIVCLIIFLFAAYTAYRYHQTTIEGNGPIEYSIKYSSSSNRGAKIFDEQGHEVASLDNLLHLPGSTIAVIHNQHLYWLDNTTKNLTELRVMDLRTKETKAIYSGQRLEFKFDHKKDAIAVGDSSFDEGSREGRAAVSVVELPNFTHNDVVQDVKKYMFGEYAHFEWSSDDTTLCFTYGITGDWDDFIIYKNKQIIHARGAHGGDDTIFDCDFGWVVYSDYPEIYDNTSRQEYEHSGKMNNLWLYDVFQQKRVKVATTVASRFETSWEEPSQKTRRFVYYIGDKKFIVDPLVLLKSAETTTNQILK